MHFHRRFGDAYIVSDLLVEPAIRGATCFRDCRMQDTKPLVVIIDDDLESVAPWDAFCGRLAWKHGNSRRFPTFSPLRSCFTP